MDEATRFAIPGSSVTVSYNLSTAVTRKRTDTNGVARFGGWVGRARRVPHSLEVSAEGFVDASATVQLQPGKLTSVSVMLKRAAPRPSPLPSLGIDSRRILSVESGS